ncbi:hypothetical protein WAC87_000395 [Shigella flexneri]
MEHFDVAIIGLGPAGSALARKLAGKMQVLFPSRWPDFVCGREYANQRNGGDINQCRIEAIALYTSQEKVLHRAEI